MSVGESKEMKLFEMFCCFLGLAIMGILFYVVVIRRMPKFFWSRVEYWKEYRGEKRRRERLEKNAFPINNFARHVNLACLMQARWQSGQPTKTPRQCFGPECPYDTWWHLVFFMKKAWFNWRRDLIKDHPELEEFIPLHFSLVNPFLPSIEFPKVEL